MKNFNREAIKRMFDGRTGGGGVGSNGADLAGYATQMWVNQNYVSIEFFNRLFSIHGHDPEDESTPPTDISVLPNDMDSIVDSIESMVGFWTEEYLSALGQNDDQGGGGITLNAALASINNSPLGNPTGTNTVLMFNGTTWVYATMGSTDMSTVWNALAAATNQQINISHLTTALSGYATTSQLSDYATVTDLEQLASYFNTLSGYFTNGAANEAVKLETARTIWGQQFDGTANITGDITQATCLEFSGIAGTATNGGFIDFHYAGGGADYTSRIIEDVSGVLKINNTIWAQLSGNVSIGTSTISQTYKLDVAGYTKTTRLYLADGVYLEYDSTNSGVHLVGAGFYSDSYVSALGVNSGGGGSITLNEPLNSINNAGLSAPSTSGQAIVWNGSAWVYSIYTTLRAAGLYSAGTIASYGNFTSTQGDFIAASGHGFKVTGSDNTSVLLAGGGTKPLSEIGSAYTLPAATAAALGGVKVTQSYGTEAIFEQSGNIQGRNYGLEIDSNQKAFVYVPWEDTKNTAGATNNGSTKLFLIGATAQSNNPQTYSNLNCYIGSDNFLYSNGSRVLTTAETGFLPLTGGTLTGRLTIRADAALYHKSTDDSEYYMYIGHDETNLCSWMVNIKANTSIRLYDSGGCTIDTGLTAASFIKTGGTSSQFLKADGSVDSSVYLTDSDAYTTSTTRTANTVLAAPNGSNGSASFRKLVAADIPDLSGTYSTIDTKNTAGNYMTSSKIWFVGTLASSTVQSSYAVTYTNVNCYISGSKLYSNNEAVLTSSTETKNTAGNFNVGASGGALNRIYLTGTASYSNAQDSYQVTSVNSYCYIDTDNCLYSNGSKVLTVAETGFLPLTGGTLTSSNLEVLNLNGTGSYTLLTFNSNGSSKGWIGYTPYNAVAIAALTAYDFSVALSTGYVGINVQSPSYRLHVGGTIYSSNCYTSGNFIVYGETAFYHFNSSGNLYMYIGHDQSTAMSWWYNGVSGESIKLFDSGGCHINTNLTASSFIKSGGTSSQFLKADGSVDSNTYLTTTPTNMTISQSLSVGTRCLLQSGMKGQSICYECASDGTPDNNRTGEINRYNNTLHLQYDSGTGGVTMCQQGFTFTNTGSTRSITINASLQLTCGSGTPYTDKNWVYNSDMRKKDVIRLIDMDAQRIADAPIFDFTWKSDTLKELTLGTSAQYWQKVFPNAVRTTPDGYLGMDYSSIALASAVLTARKVVDHEARIRLLEVENAALRNEINQLKKVA